MIDIKQNRYLTEIAEDWLDTIKSFFNQERNVYIDLGHKKKKYFNSYAAKLQIECLQVISRYTQNKVTRSICKRRLKYWWKNIDKIILCSPEDIYYYIKILNNKSSHGIKLLDELSPILVKYYDLIAKKYGNDLVNRLNIKTCPYCNRQFIYTFRGRVNERPELDHFYPKAKYPIFCLSFYNLIPACHSCNHVKSEEIIGVNPYSRAFKSKFVITDERGNILNKSQIYQLGTGKKFILDFNGDDKAEKLNITNLGLKDVYNKHIDYVEEMIDKSMAYDEHARSVLIESFQSVGYSPRQVYDFVWGRYLTEATYEDRPLSKLTKDILDLLDIKRG